MKLEDAIDQLWEMLEECAIYTDPNLAVKVLSEKLDPSEVDLKFGSNDLQQILHFLNLLSNFIREKKKEAKSRGVKSLYGH